MDFDALAKEMMALLVDKHFPKGKCSERGIAMVLLAEMLTFIDKNYVSKQECEKRMLEASLAGLPSKKIISAINTGKVSPDRIRLVRELLQGTKEGLLDGQES